MAENEELCLACVLVLTFVGCVLVIRYFMCAKQDDRIGLYKYADWIPSSNVVFRTQYVLLIPDDEVLIKNIRRRWLVGPSSVALNLTSGQTLNRSQVGQPKYVDALSNEILNYYGKIVMPILD